MLLVLGGPEARAQFDDKGADGSLVEPCGTWSIDVSASQELQRAVFLERSSIFYDLPNVGPEGNKPLVFEAQIAPHFFFYNALSLLERDCFDGGAWMPVVGFTFQLRLRMVGDASTPVRPPSYMPRFDLQLFKVLRIAGDGVPSGRKSFDLLGLRLTPWGHHSNGQQECSFAEGIRDDVRDAPCPPIDRAVPPQDLLNFRAGNFSTNYIIAGAHWARIFVDSELFEVARFGGGLLAETNPLGFGPGTIDVEQRELYGPHRLRLEGELALHPWRFLGAKRTPFTGVVRSSLSLEWMFGGIAQNVPYDRQSLEFAYIFDGLGGMGLFARGIRGQDYLNILFAQPAIATVQGGIVWDQSPRAKYGFLFNRP